MWCLTPNFFKTVNFLLIKTFSNTFRSTIFRVSSLLSPLNYESVNIADDEGCFQFSPEAEVISSLNVHINLATDTDAESPGFAQQLQR